MTAFSILIVGAFEPHLYNVNRAADYYIAGLCWQYILGISVFAFLLTVAREIVKDIEDIEGDNHYYVSSIPIAWGIKTAKGIIYAVLFFVFVGILYLLWVKDFSEKISYLIYGCIFLVFLLITLYFAMRAIHKNEYRRLSTLLKIDMFMGILFLPIYFLTEF